MAPSDWLPSFGRKQPRCSKPVLLHIKSNHELLSFPETQSQKFKIKNSHLYLLQSVKCDSRIYHLFTEKPLYSFLSKKSLPTNYIQFNMELPWLNKRYELQQQRRGYIEYGDAIDQKNLLRLATHTRVDALEVR